MSTAPRDPTGTQEYYEGEWYGAVVFGCGYGKVKFGGECKSWDSLEQLAIEYYNKERARLVGNDSSSIATPRPEPQRVQCPAVNPGGMGTMTRQQVVMSRPGWQAPVAYYLGRISSTEARKNFPDRELEDGRGDAWRHFHWNFSMARRMGNRAAAAFANAHEVNGPNSAAQHEMDLFNNAMGRAFASAYPNMSPNEAANLALRSSCLRILDQ